MGDETVEQTEARPHSGARRTVGSKPLAPERSGIAKIMLDIFRQSYFYLHPLLIFLPRPRRMACGP